MTRHIGTFKNFKGIFQGFTLAEILITLGIIGVIAAITMPSLIAAHKAKELESRFKKTYSVISQAYILTKNTLGIDNIHETYTYYDYDTNSYVFAEEFINEYNKNLKVIKTVDFYSYKNYNGTRTITENRGNDYPAPCNILPDGSSVNVSINADGDVTTKKNIWIAVDTNGPKGGPNKYGHDIFRFMIDNTDRLMPVKPISEDSINPDLEDIAGRPCDIKSSQLANGEGCAWYALNNICPWDKKKKYWETLPK